MIRVSTTRIRYRVTDSPGSSLVRPYAVTGGRTKPRYQLAIEAMVAASHYEARDLSVLSPECQAILGFCRDWRSVAEISAMLRMPLGVARVLIADMAGRGSGPGPPAATMRRRPTSTCSKGFSVDFAGSKPAGDMTAPR